MIEGDSYSLVYIPFILSHINFSFDFAGNFLSPVNISRQIQAANCSFEFFMDISWFLYLANLLIGSRNSHHSQIFALQRYQFIFDVSALSII